MATKELNPKNARFDTRLSKEQKDFFEKAARLGGFRNLTDFVIIAVQEKAKEIISEREQIIASQKDSEIFFDVVMNPKAPNEALTKATNEFKALFS
uniref:type II toxin-antitoxin system TacA family antitoxin n=1 Tax=Flavobacterium sp. TaxID=239 RepID=UPI00404AB797